MSNEEDILRSMTILMTAIHEERSFERLWAIMHDSDLVHRLIDDERIDPVIRWDVEDWFKFLERKENEDVWDHLRILIQHYTTDPRGIQRGQRLWPITERISGGLPTSFGPANYAPTCPHCGQTLVPAPSM